MDNDKMRRLPKMLLTFEDTCTIGVMIQIRCLIHGESEVRENL